MREGGVVPPASPTRRDRAPALSVDTFVLKLVLTPALIGTASLAGRRWGPAVSGWLVGIPFTSGPIALFLAMSHGTGFAAAAAAGTMAGTISQAAFGLAYAWLAARLGSAASTAAGTLAFIVSTIALQRVTLPLAPLFALVALALLAALLLMPRARRAARAPAPAPPAWDIPARMVVATAFVLLLTGIAPALGPRLTGLLSPFPLYAAVLTVFAHRLQGPAPAVDVLRGLLLGLFAFAGFFLALAALIERAGIGPAFAAAALVTLAIQAIALVALRRGRRAGSSGASS
jgi:hypothetical protein